MDSGEQRLVAVARHMYFVDRIPMKEVVLWLRSMGVVDPSGKPFSLARVFEMIHSPKREPPEDASPKKA